MVLQYKGFNNNWCYEEADIVTSAIVYVGEVAESYRKRESEYEDKLLYSEELYKAVNDLIIKETACDDTIEYHTNKLFDQLGNVVVVMLKDRNKNITRVFDSGVYLLNNHGQTVQRLA